jgi:hypothetical protein
MCPSLHISLISLSGAYNISHIKQLPEERIETYRAAGIKVRDFAYELILSSCKASEIFDLVPYQIAAYWHMRNKTRNSTCLAPKGLLRLIKMGQIRRRQTQLLLTLIRRARAF